MAAKKTVVSKALVGLAAIVAATKADSFVYTSAAEHTQLIADGLVEINVTVKDEAGNIATRATAIGIAKIDGGVTAVATSKPKPTFTIDQNVAVPAVSGRGRSGSVYPFDEMEVGHSFFVDKAAKELASTISSANARYAVLTGNMRKNRAGEDVPETALTRRYIVRTVKENNVVGARIWRVA